MKLSSSSKGHPDTEKRTRFDFSILCVAKNVSCEAEGILYSESVFRFILYRRFSGESSVVSQLNRLRKVTPKMMNITLDVDDWAFSTADDEDYSGNLVSILDLKINLNAMIELFEGLEYNRRIECIRFLDFTTTVDLCLRCYSATSPCRQLKLVMSRELSPGRPKASICDELGTGSLFSF